MSDEDILAAFRLFLEGVGGPAIPGLRVADRGKVLAALDVLDPEFAEGLSEQWGPQCGERTRTIIDGDWTHCERPVGHEGRHDDSHGLTWASNVNEMNDV